MEEFNRIIAQDRPEADRLAQAFDYLAGKVVEHARLEVELARAMNDQETLVKTQIKLSVMQHAREIMQFCRQRLEAQKEARP